MAEPDYGAAVAPNVVVVVLVVLVVLVVVLLLCVFFAKFRICSHHNHNSTHLRCSLPLQIPVLFFMFCFGLF
jgi:uncharacterized PurR-regulated membrane protein YhhQ (DUF165 family)